METGRVETGRVETGRLEIVRSDQPIETAGGRLAVAIRAAQERRPFARVAIPGGSALAAFGLARAMLGPARWQRMHLTWVDERCVPLASPDSNRGAALKNGPLEVALELPLVLDGEAPAASVARVEAALRTTFDAALDVTLLGMGEDGHIASLFPGHAAPPTSALAAHIANSPKPPKDRITLTRAILRTAGSAILLATGEGKRAALQRLLGGDSSLPAHGLANLVVVTDLAHLEPTSERSP